MVSESEKQRETRDGLAPQPAHKPNYFPDLSLAEGALLAGRVGLWSWDIRAGRITWSSNLEDIHGLPAGGFDGSVAAFERDIHPGDRAAVRAAIERALETGELYRVRYRLPAANDDQERWVEATGVTIFENGAAVRMQGICQDITDRMALESELRDRVDQQEAISRLGEKALTEMNIEKLLAEVVGTVAETLRVEFVDILELVPGDAEFLLRAGTGWDEGQVGSAHVPTGPDSQAGYTLSSGGPVIVEDFSKETRFSTEDLLRRHGIVGGISVTIAGRDGRAYGILGAHTRRKRRFAERDVSFMFAVAHVVAGAIQRRQMDQRQELMIRELRHRSGNLF